LEGCEQIQDCVGIGMQEEVVGLLDVVVDLERVVVGVQV
jgi:hypothetical protein